MRTHPLTAAQREHLRKYTHQIAQLQQMASSFLEYVVSEAGLPPAKGGWVLSNEMSAIEGDVDEVV